MTAGRHAKRGNTIGIYSELTCMGANKSQGFLNVFDLCGPRAIRSTGKSVVDRKGDITKRAQFYCDLLAPRFVAAPPRSTVNGNDGRSVCSTAVRFRFVEVERSMVTDAWVITQVFCDVVWLCLTATHA